MKKVLFVLAFVAVYGVSMAMSNSSVLPIAEDAQVILVTDMDDNIVVTSEEGDKDKKKGKSKTKSDAKSKDCGDSKTKSKDCDGKAKADCDGKAKAGCDTACGGEK